MVSKVYQLPDEEFRQIVSSSISYSEVLRRIGLSHGRSNNDLVKKRCQELNISCEHFRRYGNESQPAYSLEEILIENSSYRNMGRLKKRLLKEGLLEYQCAICGNTGMWNDQPLSLQIDHINGIHDDNRLENLRFLCPNCHTQTETYGSKRGTKSE